MNTQSNRILRAMLLALAAGACIQAHAVGEAKNVILFLDGGMGPTTVTATRIYRVDEAECLTMGSLKCTARIETYSSDAQITDNTPSMLTYMIGVKVSNEAVSMSVDTRASDAAGKDYVNGADSICPANNGMPAVMLLELVRAAGKSVGTVMTTRVAHAVPAATYSHICHRDGENQMAVQGVPGNALYNTALKNGLDMLLGGGRRHYLPQGTTGSEHTDATDLTAQFQAVNYTYVSTGMQLAAINPVTTNKLLNLFNLDHMNCELNRVKKSVGEPSLTDITEKATCMLQKDGEGYLLVVEGGRIDHAPYGTNARRTLEDAGASDEAVKHTLSTADLSNTLIVVTADHDHTMTINGYPRKGNPIPGVLNDIKTGRSQLAADGLSYTILVLGNNGTTHRATCDDVAAADTTADDYLQEVGVQFGTPGSETHSGGDVMLLSSGPGSAPLKGALDNTKAFDVVKTAMGL